MALCSHILISMGTLYLTVELIYFLSKTYFCVQQNKLLKKHQQLVQMTMVCHNYHNYYLKTQ